jgi:hypothetical protein
MKEAGYIYVLINPSMEGLVKIGKTTRDPEFRAKELSQATGVASPFYVAFNVYVPDCHSAEEFVHAILENKGFRNTANREFFQMPLNQAIEVLLLAQKELQQTGGEEVSQESEDSENGTSKGDELEDAKVEKHPGREVFEQAIRIYYGQGDEIENRDEGVRLLGRAKALNYPAAFTSLAQHFRNLADEIVDSADEPDEDAVWTSRQDALAVLKEGAQKGHGRCWIMMAFMYLVREARRDHKPDPVNASKCWKKYFQSETFRKDDDQRWTEGCKGIDPSLFNGGSRDSHIDFYLSNVMYDDMPLDPEIRGLLQPLKAQLIERLHSAIEAGKQRPDLFEDADGARQLVCSCQEQLDFVQRVL